MATRVWGQGNKHGGTARRPLFKSAAVTGPIGGLLLFALAALSIHFTRADHSIATVWLPNALAVAYLWRRDREVDAGFLFCLWLGNLAADHWLNADLWRAAVLSAGNICEIALVSIGVRRLCGVRADLRDPEVLLRFAGVSLAGPLAGALLAAALFTGTTGLPPAFVWRFVATDILSLLLVTPAAMVIADALAHPRLPTRGEARDWLLLTAFGIVVTALVFAQSRYPLLSLVAPVVVVHAFRLGALGTALSIVQIAAIATFATRAGHGPIIIAGQGLAANLLILQAFLASAMLVGLPIAGTLRRRDRMARALANREAQLALLTDHITDAILRFDREGRCRYASPSTAKVLGRPPREAGKRALVDFAHPAALAPVAAVQERLSAGGAAERLLFRRWADDAEGRPVHIEADCAPAFAPDGTPAGFVVSARDASERVALQADLVRARRHAENAAAAKAQFLANMSHEIRTPMNGVLGFADMLLQSTLTAEQESHARLIARSAQSMMLLLNDILDLSKIEARALSVTHEPFDLVALLRECVALHGVGARQKGLVLALRGLPDHPIYIASDPLRLRQIVLNLLGNAIKFTDHGAVELWLCARDERFTVTVRDTGIGIAPDRLEAVFAPFEQNGGVLGSNAGGDTQSAPIGPTGGTGLGLAISRHLAALLGGTLTVRSQRGRGSDFCLDLPSNHVAAAGAALQPPPPPTRWAQRTARILLAEDHDVNRLLVEAMLQSSPHALTSVGDGSAAVAEALRAQAAGEPYDLVLMDVQMPGLDGHAAARQLRAAGIGPQTLPILALTANAYPEDVAAALEAGMQAHLAKPLVHGELVAAINHWLPNSRSLSHAPPLPVGEAAGLPPAQPGHSPALLARWRTRRAEAVAAVAQAVPLEEAGAAARSALARTVHQLAGTAALFGEAALGEHASALEQALRTSGKAAECDRLARAFLSAS